MIFVVSDIRHLVNNKTKKWNKHDRSTNCNSYYTINSLQNHKLIIKKFKEKNKSYDRCLLQLSKRSNASNTYKFVTKTSITIFNNSYYTKIKEKSSYNFIKGTWRIK